MENVYHYNDQERSTYLPSTVRLTILLETVMDPLVTVQVYRPESVCLREEKENISSGDGVVNSAPFLRHSYIGGTLVLPPLVVQVSV